MFCKEINLGTENSNLSFGTESWSVDTLLGKNPDSKQEDSRLGSFINSSSNLNNSCVAKKKISFDASKPVNNSEPAMWSVESLSRSKSKTSSGYLSKSKQQESCNVIVGSKCKFKGSLYLDGNVQIDGEVDGDIKAQGVFTIGEQGQIKASIEAETVRIFGQVVGNVLCTDRLELFSGARLKGDIICGQLVIHDGAVFDGACKMDAFLKYNDTLIQKEEYGDDSNAASLLEPQK